MSKISLKNILKKTFKKKSKIKTKNKVSKKSNKIKKKLPKISNIDKVNWSVIDLVYLSLPNGESQKLVKNIYYKYTNIKFIDLSADFRISDVKKYKTNYKANFFYKKYL